MRTTTKNELAWLDQRTCRIQLCSMRSTSKAEGSVARSPRPTNCLQGFAEQGSRLAKTFWQTALAHLASSSKQQRHGSGNTRQISPKGWIKGCGAGHKSLQVPGSRLGRCLVRDTAAKQRQRGRWFFDFFLVWQRDTPALERRTEGERASGCSAKAGVKLIQLGRRLWLQPLLVP